DAVDRREALARGVLVIFNKGFVGLLRLLFTSKYPWLGPLVASVVVFALFAYLTPDTFLRTQNGLTMARQAVVITLCALGMTMVIVTGGIDLSTGSLVAFT